MRTNTDGRVRDSVMAHRYRFLRAVQELVPEVLTDLERDVFPSFRALYREEPSRELGESGDLYLWRLRRECRDALGHMAFFEGGPQKRRSLDRAVVGL